METVRDHSKTDLMEGTINHPDTRAKAQVECRGQSADQRGHEEEMGAEESGETLGTTSGGQ